MPVNISALDQMLPNAVTHFWTTRKTAAQMQEERGVRDQGTRSQVTAGKNLDGFTQLVRRLITDNGLTELDVLTNGRLNLTIPGFYRPTKNWDLLVVSRRRLIAAIEVKSQVGSFGNNFNNRVEEALGNATDLNTAFREGAFGESHRPFLGYIFVLEECEGSMRPVRIDSPHFPELPEFHGTSYAQRYEILCRKLVHEQLYDAACLVLTKQESGLRGDCRHLSELTSVRRFAAELAGKIAALSAEWTPALGHSLAADRTQEKPDEEEQ